jgi:radical SAM protein with 4Fe4S-binding SPASM domain
MAGGLIHSANKRTAPVNAMLHVTHRCDLACQHCFQTEETHPEHDAMTRQEIQRVLDQLAEAGTLYLTLTGGEPFLRRDLFDIIADARERRFAVTVKTAGHHINEEKAQKLKALNVHEVQISLYSHVPEQVDAFTGRKGTFERTVRAFRLLRGAGVRTNMRAAMTRFNHRHLRELRAFGTSLGATVQLDPSVNVRTNGDASSLDLALTAEERATVFKELDQVPGAVTQRAADICNGTGGFSDGTRAMCGAARTTLSISATGEMHPCVLHPHSGGNALKDGLLQVWDDSSLFKDIRSITYGEMERTGCHGCGYQASCHPCMALAATEHGKSRECNTSSYINAKAVHLLALERGGILLKEAPPVADPPFMRSGRGLLRVVA